VREDAREVALALERRPAGDVDERAKLVGDHMRERGLAKPWRPAEEHMVERLLALARRGHEHAKVVEQRPLADDLLEGARPQRTVEPRVLAQGGGGDGPVVALVVDHWRRKLSYGLPASIQRSPPGDRGSSVPRTGPRPRGVG